MSEVEQNVSILKRQIIATDKLLKHKSKTDNTNKTLNTLLKEKDDLLATKVEEIVNLKNELTKKSSSIGTGENGNNKNLTDQLESTRKNLEEKTTKVAKLMEESITRSQQIGQLEIEVGKKKGRLDKVEAELNRKNADVIKRELDNQKLVAQLEETELAKNNLQKDIASGKAMAVVKKSYDDLKWSNLAEISGLKQEKAALVERVKELTALVEPLQKKNQALEQNTDQECKRVKHNESFEKIIEKKDRTIDALQRKLDKAMKTIEKLQSKKKSGDTYSSSFIDVEKKLQEDELCEISNSMDVSHESVAGDSQVSENEIEIGPNRTQQRKRLSLFTFSQSSSRFFVGRPDPKICLKSKVIFTKLGKVIEEESLGVVFNCSPIISDSLPRRPSTPNLQVKRKRTNSQRKSPGAKKQKFKESPKHPVDMCPIPDSTSPHTQPSSTSTPKSIGQRDKYNIIPDHSLNILPFMVPLPKTSLPTAPTIPSKKLSVLSSTPDGYSDPNPPKKRQARQNPITPLATPSQNITPLATPPPKVKEIIKSKPRSSKKMASAPQPLSPIKSPVAKPSITPTKEDPGVTSARSKLMAATSLTPQPVEAQARQVGGRLNAVQMEAARRRAVPSMPFIPSVDGFRQSANEGKVAVKGTSARANTKDKNLKSSKPETKAKIQSLRKTNPKLASSNTEVIVENGGPEHVDTEVEETKTSNTSETSENSHTPPKAEKMLQMKETKYKSQEFLESSDDSSPETTDIKSKPEVHDLKETQVNNSDEADHKKEQERSNSLDEDLVLSDDDESEYIEKDVKTSSSKESLSSVPSDLPVKETCSLPIPQAKTPLKDVKHSVSQPPKKENTSLLEPLSTEASKHTSKEPLAVPIKTSVYKTYLEDLWYSFKGRSREAQLELQAERDRLSKERAGYAYEAHLDGIKKQFRNLMGCQNQESYERILEGLSSNSSSENPAMICDLVYEYLRAEHRESPLLNEQSEDNPAITRQQQRLFALLVSLQARSYPAIMDQMLCLLWHGFFGRDRMYHLKLNAVQNCGRMFILCARHNDDVHLVRHFVYDLFYFKSPRNHILVGIVVALWPEVFPHSSSPSAGNPLVESLVWAVFNTGPGQKSPEMKCQQTQDNFVKEYGYKQHSTKAEELIVKFIGVAKTTKDSTVLDDLTRCLLLIGKCKDYRWVNNNISNRLLKCLADVWSQGGDQTMLRWVLCTLGLLSRVYPAEGRDQLKQLFDPIILMLGGGELLPETEIVCVRALLHLGYHLQSQVAMFLKTWKPKHQPLEPETRRLLEDFLGTRGKKHAEITVNVSRIEENRRRKRKGVK